MAMDPITAAFDLGGKLIDRLWQDPAKKGEAALEMMKLQQSGELQKIAGQMDINKEEAKSQSVFVAGWRPFIGWVCGSGLAYQFIARPLLQFTVSIWRPSFAAPGLEMSSLIEILMGILGLGVMRTVEKLNDAQSNGH